MIGIPLEATQQLPWLPELGEFEWRESLSQQSSSYASQELFLDSSLATSLFDFGFEVEALAAHTRRQKGIDDFKATLRYRWLDDIEGEAVSLTSGVSLSQCFRRSLHNPSVFHHGYLETELFLSVGKEFNEGCYDLLDYEVSCSSRLWAVVAGGVAVDRGSPWARFNVSYEKQVWQKHLLRVFMTGLYGCGGEGFHLDDFKGYGPIAHRSLELGVRYGRLIDCLGEISIEYSNRLYARHCLKHVSQFTLQLTYPFGL